MALITLALEASTPLSSAAVLDGDRVLAAQQVQARATTGERLLPAVNQCLEEAGLRLSAVSRIVCGAGPGGFTSLRIAGSLAKGLAVGGSIPLFAVPSHLLTVAAANDLPDGRYIVVNDAMRGEWFATEIDLLNDLIELRGEAALATADVLAKCARAAGSRILGPGASAISKDAIESSPHARGVARLGSYLDGRAAVDLALWEPMYGRLAEAQVKWEAAHGRALG